MKASKHKWVNFILYIIEVNVLCLVGLNIAWVKYCNNQRLRHLKYEKLYINFELNYIMYNYASLPWRFSMFDYGKY